MSLLPSPPALASIATVFFLASSPGSAGAQAPPSNDAPPAPAPVTAPLGAEVPSGLQTHDANGRPLRVLTLADLERVALAQQPQILVARAQTKIAEANVEITRSPFLPQLDGSAEYQYGNLFATASTGTSTGVAATSPTDASHWVFGASGSQLIYDFGQTSGKYAAAKEQVDADRYTEKATQFQVVVTVRAAYFNARADKDLVGVARENLSDQERHLTQVEGFVQVGTQPPIALAQQKAAVASAQVNLITSQNNYETAKAQLNQAAGIRGDSEYNVGDELIGPIADEEEPLAPLLGKAMAARPEIASFIKQRTAQNDTISATQGAYGPTLSAVGQINEIGNGLDDLQPFWSVGVLLNWPFFQGGLTHGQVRQAEATLSSLDAQQEEEVLQIQLQVDTARLAVRAAKATIGSAEDAESSAHEQLRLAEQRYATGVGSIIELNDAQVAYTTAAAQLVEARYQLASARAQLLAALGRTS